MKKVIEIVPNYSEGKNKDVMDRIIQPFMNKEDIYLVDLEMDASYNRSVVTVIGEVDAVVKAVRESAIWASKLIDLRIHKGEHKRMGSLDVLPILPIANISEDECITLSKEVAKAIYEDTKIPIFLYSKSATREHCVNLPDIRKGEFEGMSAKLLEEKWAPDFGGREIHPTAGVMAVGNRPFLIAFNIDLDTNDKNIASNIAKRVRFSNGGYRNIQAAGVSIFDRGHTQVTMNITDFTKTSIYQALEAVKMEAKRYNVNVVSSEIVGLCPKNALIDSLRYYLKLEEGTLFDKSLAEITSLSIKYLMLRDFEERKIIEYYVK